MRKISNIRIFCLCYTKRPQASINKAKFSANKEMVDKHDHQVNFEYNVESFKFLSSEKKNNLKTDN